MKSRIDNQIKKQLEERELPVSKDAWDRLSNMLDNEEGAGVKSRKIIWWPISAAASIILIILFVQFFDFSSKNNPSVAIIEDVKNNKNQDNTSTYSNNSVVLKQEEPFRKELISKVESKREDVATVVQEVGNKKNKGNDKIEIEQKNIDQRPIPQIERVNDVIAEEKVVIEQKPELVIPTEKKDLPKNKPEVKNDTKRTSYVDPNLLLYAKVVPKKNMPKIMEQNTLTKPVLLDFNKINND